MFNISCFIFEPNLGFGESCCDSVRPGCVPNQHLFLRALECALTSVKLTGANFSQIGVKHIELTGLGEGKRGGRHRNMVLNNLSAGDWGSIKRTVMSRLTLRRKMITPGNEYFYSNTCEEASERVRLRLSTPPAEDTEV